jgi:membrane-bound ClpP family serine protease
VSTPIGRHDTVTGLALWAMIVGGALLFVGEVATVSAAVTGVGVVLFVVGLVLTFVGATMSNRATGRGWVRSLADGGRAADRMLLDLLP